MLEGLILPLPLFFLCQFNYSSPVKIVKSMIVFIFLGVAQLLNKNNGKPFTEGDENLFEVSYSVHAVIILLKTQAGDEGMRGSALKS